MLRRLCLAVLFCLAAWALADRTPADRADSAAILAADATAASIGATVATPPIDTHPPEARWEALLPYGIGGSGSSRTTQPQAQAADLPGASSRAPWPVVSRAHAARDEARFRQPHLLHTPLLI